MCHSDGYLSIKGHQYAADATPAEVVENENWLGRSLLVLIDTGGAKVAVAEQDLSPTLAKVIKGNLAGKWVMVMEPDDKLQGRNISPELERRLEKVLAILPIRWGEQPARCELLGITQRELQWALGELAKRGLAHRPQQGTWVKTPLAGDKVEE